MNHLNYLIEFSGCLVIFYTLYFFLFRKETFSQLNRVYLLSSLVIALLIPVMPRFITVSQVPNWVKSTIYEPIITNPSIPVIENTNPAISPSASFSTIENNYAATLSLGSILWFIYILGALFFFGKLTVNLAKIGWQINHSRIEKRDGYFLVNSQQSLVCSFFNYVFWNKNLSFLPSEKHQMIAHELVHVKEGHTFDILFLELLTIIFWFHPLIYFYKKAIKSVHEYIADSYVFYDLNYKSNYAQLLIKEATQLKTSPIVSTFFNSLTKNRLIMLNRTTNPLRKLKFLIALPILSLLVLAFGIQKEAIAQIDKDFIDKIEDLVIPSSNRETNNLEPLLEEEPAENSSDLTNEGETNSIQDNTFPNTQRNSTATEPTLLSPEVIAQIEAKGNPYFITKSKNAVLILVNSKADKSLYRADGSHKSLDEIKKERLAKLKGEGKTITEADIYFYTIKQMNEYMQQFLSLTKGVEHYFTGGMRFEWTGIQDGIINDLSRTEHQIFKLWDFQTKQHVLLEKYCIMIEKGNQFTQYENLTFPQDANKFPTNIFEVIKGLQSGDKVVFYDLKYKVNGKFYLNRDKYEFIIE